MFSITRPDACSLNDQRKYQNNSPYSIQKQKNENSHIISYTNMAFERRILGKELFPTIREGS
jgi:hypothetical protein